jgi:hypothetical protein
MENMDNEWKMNNEKEEREWWEDSGLRLKLQSSLT